MPMPCCQSRVCLSRVAIHGSAPAQVAKKIAAAIHQLRLSVESDANTPSDAQAQYLLPQPYTSTYFGYATGSNATGHSSTLRAVREYLRPPENIPCDVCGSGFHRSANELASVAIIGMLCIELHWFPPAQVPLARAAQGDEGLLLG